MFLTGAAILGQGDWLQGHGLLLAGDRIEAILPETAQVSGDRRCLPPGSLLCPGLIDIQVNGGGGLLFNDAPTQQTARAIAAAHRKLGTTQILPTLITDAAPVMRQAMHVTAEPEAGVLGLHFEGPFISPAKPGVHPRHHIRKPGEDDLQALEQAARRDGFPFLLTLAPEELDDADLRRLHEAGVLLSAGHSAASFERTNQAIAAGLSAFTHLFNAMPPLVSREPGIAAAALTDRTTYCGVIADGIHVHPAMLKLLVMAKPGRVILVSDAMPPAGTADTRFVLQGRTIHRQDGSLRTEDGTLAGADICLADAVRFCVRTLDVPLGHAVAMASAAPADFLGVANQVGRIAPGLRTDLLLLDAHLNTLGTWLGGCWQAAAGAIPVQPAA